MLYNGCVCTLNNEHVCITVIIIVFGFGDMQASGEAQYTTDIPSLPNELAAAFVLSTQVSESYIHAHT